MPEIWSEGAPRIWLTGAETAFEWLSSWVLYVGTLGTSDVWASRLGSTEFKRFKRRLLPR